MKIMFLWPPITSPKGHPTVTGNRQFQWFKVPTYIYPLIPAQLATKLHNEGNEIIWYDGLAEGKTDREFSIDMQLLKPDVIYLEVKTPLSVDMERIATWLLKVLPNTKVIAYGEHIRGMGKDTIDYDSIPFEINRDITKWKLYAYKNGNFRKTPGAYIMSARDCWWGKCTFCSWQQLFKQYKVRPVKEVVDEIEVLVLKYGVKEIMDDSGTFPVGDWLRDFCDEIIKRKLKVTLDCNMRFGKVRGEALKHMKRAGFRMLLYGLESASQHTLNKINKGVKPEYTHYELKEVKEAGLQAHITCMFGWPWENYVQAMRTAHYVRWLLKKGLAYSAQATIAMPYPGTEFYKECVDKGLLLTTAWNDYDMTKPVVACGYNPKIMTRYVYQTMYSPEFILRKIASIRSLDDIIYMGKGFIRTVMKI